MQLCFNVHQILNNKTKQKKYTNTATDKKNKNQVKENEYSKFRK